MLLAGCASDSPDPNVPDPSLKVSDTEICPSASVSAVSRALSGPVDLSFPPSTEGVMSVTALVNSEEGVWSNYFCNKPADTDSNSRISFSESNPMRFYPYDGSRMLRFYATSPWRESWTMDESSHILTFALSGQEDLMWAKDERGISKEFDPATQTQPKFDFTHKLTRFNFSCRAGEGFPNRIRLTEIKMYGVCYKGTLDVIDGALTWDDVSTTDYNNSNFSSWKTNATILTNSISSSSYRIWFFSGSTLTFYSSSYGFATSTRLIRKPQ